MTVAGAAVGPEPNSATNTSDPGGYPDATGGGALPAAAADVVAVVTVGVVAGVVALGAPPHAGLVALVGGVLEAGPSVGPPTVGVPETDTPETDTPETDTPGFALMFLTVIVNCPTGEFWFVPGATSISNWEPLLDDCKICASAPAKEFANDSIDLEAFPGNPNAFLAMPLAGVVRGKDVIMMRLQNERCNPVTTA
jgi:hypothetical protein